MNTPLCPPEIDSLAELKQLQRLMGEALFRPLGRDDELQKTWTDGRPINEVASSFIKRNDRLTSVDRLEIYSRQYWFRLLDCLYDDYPGLRALLGEKKFHALCRAYLEKHQSRSFTLRNLGSKLEEFIRADPIWAGAKLGMALDIVQFEWAQTLAFDEAAKPPVRGDDLLGMSPEKLTLDLQPHLVLLELDYAVDHYFMAVRGQEAGMRGEASNAFDAVPQRAAPKRKALPKKEKIWLAVHRCDNDLYFLRMEKEAYRMLSAIGEGKTVELALETALWDADPSQDWGVKIKDWFENWAALGWFCKRKITRKK